MNDVSKSGEGLNGRSIVPVLLLLGAAGLIAAWVFNKTHSPAPPVLSDSTRAVIASISEPVEIRFYSGQFDPSAESATRKLSDHAWDLIRTYAQASAGKITAKEFAVTNEAVASAALTDGIRPFNIEKGDAKYLGLVFQSDTNKEVLAVLLPDYAPALEADITRALKRLADANSAAVQANVQLDAPSASTVENVRSNYAAVPLEQGSRQLREKMISDLHKTGTEMESKLEAAREAFKKAEASGDRQAMESARKAITAAELEQNEALKQIISGSASDLRALETIKKP